MKHQSFLVFCFDPSIIFEQTHETILGCIYHAIELELANFPWN